MIRSIILTLFLVLLAVLISEQIWIHLQKPFAWSVLIWMPQMVMLVLLLVGCIGAIIYNAYVEIRNRIGYNTQKGEEL